jgi:hypothetical protein
MNIQKQYKEAYINNLFSCKSDTINKIEHKTCEIIYVYSDNFIYIYNFARDNKVECIKVNNSSNNN